MVLLQQEDIIEVKFMSLVFMSVIDSLKSLLLRDEGSLVINCALYVKSAGRPRKNGFGCCDSEYAWVHPLD